MLGFGEWQGQITEIGRLFGLTKAQTFYWLYRDRRLERRRQTKADKGKAMLIQGGGVVSPKLGFSIWLPNKWQIDSEYDSHDDVSEGLRHSYRRCRE